MSTKDFEHKYVWYSICSMHQDMNPQCGMCHAGQYIDENDPEHIADKKLFTDDPDAWREKHNRFAANKALLL